MMTYTYGLYSLNPVEPSYSSLPGWYQRGERGPESERRLSRDPGRYAYGMRAYNRRGRHLSPRARRKWLRAISMETHQGKRRLAEEEQRDHERFGCDLDLTF
jgi:hypothetical protein